MKNCLPPTLLEGEVSRECAEDSRRPRHPSTRLDLVAGAETVPAQLEQLPASHHARLALEQESERIGIGIGHVTRVARFERSQAGSPQAPSSRVPEGALRRTLRHTRRKSGDH